ncbi:MULTISPECIES: DUF3549 family protein [Marinomonas]|uniref:DUF3549 family protein n=1 Tax=Marinomonas arctica TaxID=383750 RepID=A0A7H1J279_9GAMM|nr:MULTISPECIES: DUF3549 family protein [Marinomonas]MCS7488321.1 hypothetical protein [Marinomonas sp. BSi20414]QNT04595.1 DUF3549 family protein [Marinomonas arctica]GGN32859.1 hypothetical protein GCM10011350_27740 [Marinomonas arctica]
MNKIESLSDLFDMVGCDVSYYDLGRNITKITPQQAIQFDRKQQAYPFPFRQHAWLACLLTSKDTAKKDSANAGVIWFVKLPLDEAGCLNLGTRDHFIKSIVDKILHKGEEAGLSEALEDNPYVFKPDQERMASFHAILGKNLHKAPSHYFDDVVKHLSSDVNKQDDSWQTLGLQGIAELAARVDEDTYQALIQKAIQHAAKPVVSALCHALEHETLSSQLQETLIAQLQTEQDALMQASYLRALSRAELNNTLLLPLFGLLGSLTECQDNDLHPIAALAAKCPHWLGQNPQLLRIIMEKLAHREDGYIAFRQIAAELSQHPEAKQPLWSLLRCGHVSPKLAQAVSYLFTQTPTSVQ